MDHGIILREILGNWKQNVAPVVLSSCNHTAAEDGRLTECLPPLSPPPPLTRHPLQGRTTTPGRGNASPGTWPCAWRPADSSTAPCATAEPSRRRTSGSTWRASSTRPKCQSWGTAMRWRTWATAKRPVGGSVEEKLRLHLYGRIIEILRPLDLLSFEFYINDAPCDAKGRFLW